MNAAAAVMEQRRTDRAPLGGAVRYVTGPGQSGFGTWRDISVHGAGVYLGRYIAPGRLVLLEDCAARVEFKCRVVWCAPEPDRVRFSVGLRVFPSDGEVTAFLDRLAARA